MTKHIELPEGYRLESCDDIGLAVPVPASWNAWSYPASPRTHIHCFAEQCFVRPDGKLQYETGLSIGTFRRVRALTGYAPARLAVSLATGIHGARLLPTSEVEEHINGSLTFFSRTFERPAEETRKDPALERSYAISGISHDETDTAYIMVFETPADQWDIDREIGRTMIDGVRIIER